MCYSMKEELYELVPCVFFSVAQYDSLFDGGKVVEEVL